MIRRAAMLLLVCGGLAFFLQREEMRGTFDPWHRAVLERLSGRAPAIPVVIVEMRRGDLPFESWPPAPLDYAPIFESLVRRQPRAVAVDSPLAWPEVAALDAATLAERIALLPRGVLSCTLQRGVIPTPVEAAAPVPLEALPNVRGDVSRVPEFSVVGQVPIEEVRGSKAIGFSRIEFGAEPVAVGESSVRIPLVARRGKEVVPSLLLQALMAWKGRGAAEISIELGRRIVIADDLILPIDGGGWFAVFSRLTPELRRAAAGSLLLDMEQDGKLLKSQPAENEALAAIHGALVVVGETGEGTPRVAVGAGRDWTETELLAQGLAAALTGHHIREVPRRWQWSIWGATVACALALCACSRRWVMAFGLAGSVVLALSVLTAFLVARWWLPPLPLLTLWAVAVVIALFLAAPGPAPRRAAAPLPTQDTPAPPSEELPTDPAPEETSLARTLVDEEPAPPPDAGAAGTGALCDRAGERCFRSSPDTGRLPTPKPCDPPGKAASARLKRRRAARRKRRKS